MVLCYLEVLTFVAIIASVSSRTIYIDPSTGADSPECLTANSQSSPCANLTWVFNQSHSSSTHYVLSGATHYLKAPTPAFQDLNSLALTGNNSLVTCTQPNTGLAFINIRNLTLRDITFLNCSSLRNSTSRKYDYSRDVNFSFVLYESYVALYFLRCSDVTMIRLTVSESPSGTAVVMYNTKGAVTVSDSSFTHNKLYANSSTKHPGGGGFYVEFTYCVPGNTSCDEHSMTNSIIDFNQNSTYVFRNVSFSFNRASNLPKVQNMDTYIIPYGKIHNSFGKGGGLALVFKGNASNISVEVTECVFERNEAVWGSGLLVEFQDYSNNITVLIQRSSFSANGGLLDEPGVETAGGGIRIANFVYSLEDVPKATKNRVLINGCEVRANHARNGGGVSIFPVRQLVHSSYQLFEVEIVDTDFTDNRARIGAAVECTLFALFTYGQLLPILVQSSVFKSNSIHHETEAAIREVGIGAFYTNGVPINFRSDVRFEQNIGSALAMVEALADFSDCNASFVGNRGSSGGAVMLLGSAYLLVNNHTIMMFMENQADVSGGAIANVFTARENFKAYPNCFVRHVKPFAHPHEWGSTFKFVDNSAGILGQSIYTTSLNPCAWAGGSGVGLYDDILCWHGWEYIRNGMTSHCHKEMNTDSGTITFPGDDTREISISTTPGKEFQIPIQIRDDLNVDINSQTVFSATSSNTSISNVNSRYTFVSAEYIRMDGIGGNNIIVKLQSSSERAWEVEVSVELQKCPPGFIPSHSHLPANSHCICDPDNYKGLVHCSADSDEARIVNGYWFGQINDTDGRLVYAASLCLPGFCATESNNTLKVIPSDPNKLEREICGDHRKGILCGECEEGFGPSINSENYDCIACNGSTVITSIVKYVFSTYIPLLALFIFIIVFGVRLTSGPANAFIFYAQVVSSTFDLNADSHIPLQVITKHSDALLQAYRVPYGIFNLDFIESFVGNLCVGTTLTALDVLELEYLIAFFPLVMILVVVIAVRIKDSSLFSYYCSRCSFQNSSWKFLRHWKANESLLHAFSAFLLLSYIKFSLTSSYLVNIHPFYDAKGTVVGERRAYYAGQFTASDLEYFLRYKLPACIVLTLIAVPPLVLFGYPVVWLEKCLIRVQCLWRFYPADKVQIFLDTFQGCYKDNRRFFAGMYFAFRMAINVCYILTDDWLQQFVAQQVLCTVFVFVIALCWPYREEKWYINYVDLLIFTNLAAVNALSLYLFAYAQINSEQTSLNLPAWPFAVQYVLVFLPLMYMIVYVVWYLLPPRGKQLLKKIACYPVTRFKKWKRDKYYSTTILGPSEGARPNQKPSKTTTRRGNVSITECVVGMDGVSTSDVALSDGSQSEEEEILASDDSGNLEAILVRAQTQNTYKSMSSTVTGSSGHGWDTYASGHMTGHMSRDSGHMTGHMTRDSGHMTRDSGLSSLGGGNTSLATRSGSAGRRRATPLTVEHDAGKFVDSIRHGGPMDTIAELSPTRYREMSGNYGSFTD